MVKKITNDLYIPEDAKQRMSLQHFNALLTVVYLVFSNNIFHKLFPILPA